jgi:RNA polymerase sigma factor (sigma-70 family)
MNARPPLVIVLHCVDDGPRRHPLAMMNDRHIDRRQMFERLCHLHAEQAVRLVRRRLGRTLRRRLDSQDVLQEALLEASVVFEQLPQNGLEEGDQFLRWLATIIENKVLSLARYHVRAQRRSVRREVRLPADGGIADDRRSARPASSLLVEEEDLMKLREALMKLSPRQREVIELVHFQKLRVREAAARLKKTPNATSVLLYDALQRLGGLLHKKRKDG